MTNREKIKEINSLYVRPTEAQIEKISTLSERWSRYVKPLISNTLMYENSLKAFIKEHWYD